MKTDDVITAIATPIGEGGIGVIRISGHNAINIADKIFRFSKKRSLSSIDHGNFIYGNIINQHGDIIDHGIALIMLSPKSFTGENVVELQSHGGIFILRSILSSVLNAGARLAEPGEFSKRAFLNGKIDLTQAEAICDLIRARSDRAAQVASNQLNGSLRNYCNDIYNELIEVTANLETTLDFIEDELPDDIYYGIINRLNNSFHKIDELISTWNEGIILREGINITILGRPNAGKSTLFNKLLNSNRAIISDIPGTTRDILEESYVLDGIPILLTDTAGLRNTSCDIESEGIRRAENKRDNSEIILYVIDASKNLHIDDKKNLQLLPKEKLIVILNKLDIGCSISIDGAIKISLANNEGIDILKSRITDLIKGNSIKSVSNIAISERHKSLLISAKNETLLVQKLLSNNIEKKTVLICSHLRNTLDFIGQITGQIYHDELLESIFSRFCIGK